MPKLVPLLVLWSGPLSMPFLVPRVRYGLRVTVEVMVEGKGKGRGLRLRVRVEG